MTGSEFSGLGLLKAGAQQGRKALRIYKRIDQLSISMHTAWAAAENIVGATCFYQFRFGNRCLEGVDLRRG
jgi:hypothetical protein